MVKTTSKTIPLPDGVIESDLKSPAYNSDNRILWNLPCQGMLTFHYVPPRGWCIATLPIGNARPGSGYEGRTYAIEVETKNSYSTEHNIVTIGKGPHITKTITVYVTTKREAKLKKYLDIYTEGLTAANQIRDRISTRRANTALRRSRNGLSGFGLSW